MYANTNDIVKGIRQGAFSNDDLKLLSNAITEKRKLNQQLIALNNKATLDTGDKVVLNGLRPKSINGLTVEIRKIKNTRATCLFPDSFQAGKFRNKEVTVPLSCLTPAS